MFKKKSAHIRIANKGNSAGGAGAAPQPGAAGTATNQRTQQQQRGGDVTLRDDIGCGLISCGDCKHRAHPDDYRPVLDPQHPILLPDARVVLHSTTVLEDGLISNIVFLDTVLEEVQKCNRAVYARVTKLLREEGKQAYVFSAKFHCGTHCVRAPDEDEASYRSRSVRAAFEWYARHLKQQHQRQEGADGAEAQEQEAGEEQRKTGRRRRDEDGDEVAKSSASASASPLVCLVTHDDAMKEKYAATSAVIADGAGKCCSMHDFVTHVMLAAGEQSESGEGPGAEAPAAEDTEAAAKEKTDWDALLQRSQFATAGDAAASATGAAPGGKIFEPYISQEAARAGVKAGAFIKGKIKVSENSCFFGEIRGSWPDALPGATRILVAARRNMNRAIDTDVVAVQLLPKSEWRGPSKKSPPAPEDAKTEDLVAQGYTPSAKVVAIIEEKRRPYCGSIDISDAERCADKVGTCSVLFQPKSNRIPRIRIQTSNLKSIADKRLRVIIDQWPEHCGYPLGHIIDNMGKIGDKDVEARVILMENDIPYYDFSQAVYDCLPKGTWSVEPQEEEIRLDLRNKDDINVCSVDPLGCRDIDDALHWRKLDNGCEEVGVHIADVTHFVTHGSAMDEEAQKRSTSVYLVDRRINMLPQLLTENLCSLVADEDRYAFSIIWQFDPNNGYMPVSTWYGKTIIRSKAALYYGDAQAMIDDSEDASPVATSLRGLMKIAMLMKEQRVKCGALFLSSQEFKFKIDNDHTNPTDMVKYQTFDANSMIEEWMLFANAAAASRVLETFKNHAFLRRHEPPADSSFEAINAALQKKLGFTLDVSSSLRLNQSLDRCVDPDDAFFNQLVRILVTRCLRQAQYFPSGSFPMEEYRHYGLAMPIYTHFTSPIRRYADVIVHRQLAAAVGLRARTDVTQYDQAVMEEIAANVNYRHEAAQRAGRDSQNLYTGYFLRSFPDGEIPVQDGYVVRVSEDSITVLVSKFGQEGRIPREEVPGLAENTSCAKSKSGIDYTIIFQKARIKIIVMKEGGDVLRTRLKFTIVEEEEKEKEKGEGKAEGDEKEASGDERGGKKRRVME